MTGFAEAEDARSDGRSHKTKKPGHVVSVTRKLRNQNEQPYLEKL